MTEERKTAEEKAEEWVKGYREGFGTGRTQALTFVLDKMKYLKSGGESGHFSDGVYSYAGIWSGLSEIIEKELEA